MNKLILIAALVVLCTRAYADSIVPQAEFDRCIRPAVTDTSSVEKLSVDFALVPMDCGATISAYSQNFGGEPTAVALTELTREAIEAGEVPQLQSEGDRCFDFGYIQDCVEIYEIIAGSTHPDLSRERELSREYLKTPPPITVRDIDIAGYQERRDGVVGEPFVIYEDDDIQILMVRKP